jgi:uncharacterized protein YqgC (DUF456 family)
MTAATVAAGLLMLVGLVGIVIPVLPGLFLIWGGVLIWALETQGGAWWTFGIATALLAAGLLLEYALPGRRMRRAGVRTSTLVVGVLVAIVAAFLIPVVGFLLGFPVGIYLVERSRKGSHEQAWAATKHALRAVGLNLLIELVTGLLIIATWLVSVLWLV